MGAFLTAALLLGYCSVVVRAASVFAVVTSFHIPSLVISSIKLGLLSKLCAKLETGSF